MTAQFLLPNIEGAGEADRGQVAAVLSSTQSAHRGSRRQCTVGNQPVSELSAQVSPVPSGAQSYIVSRYTEFLSDQ